MKPTLDPKLLKITNKTTRKSLKAIDKATPLHIIAGDLIIPLMPHLDEKWSKTNPEENLDLLLHIYHLIYHIMRYTETPSKEGWSMPVLYNPEAQFLVTQPLTPLHLLKQNFPREYEKAPVSSTLDIELQMSSVYPGELFCISDETLCTIELNKYNIDTPKHLRYDTYHPLSIASVRAY